MTSDLTVRTWDRARDYPRLRAWWEELPDWHAPPEGHLPDTGRIVEHQGVPLCAGFAFHFDNAALAYLGAWTVFAPDCPLHLKPAAARTLYADLRDRAREAGAVYAVRNEGVAALRRIAQDSAGLAVCPRPVWSAYRQSRGRRIVAMEADEIPLPRHPDDPDQGRAQPPRSDCGAPTRPVTAAFDPRRDGYAIARLCAQVSRIPPPQAALPREAVVVRDAGTTLGYTQLATDRARAIAYLDWIVADHGLPHMDRASVIQALVTELTNRAEEMGCTLCYAVFHHEQDRDAARAGCGYYAGEDGMDMLTADLRADAASETENDSTPPAFDRFTGGAFVPGTRVRLDTGRDIDVVDLDVGDVLRDGGTVTAVAQMELTHTYELDGIVCAGENLVWTPAGWQRVRTLDTAHPRDRDKPERVLVIGCRNHRIQVGHRLFADYLENDAVSAAIADNEDAALAALDAGERQ